MAIPDANAAERSATRGHAAILWALTLLFFLRVLGQVLAAFLHVAWLPPMKEWMSGLLPYPGLLASQILILIFQAKVNGDLSFGRGYFFEPRPRLGRFLRGFSLVYAAGMAIRYGVTMTLFPERRWLGTGTIPIVFHFVLAGWLFTLAHALSRTREARGASLDRA
jgi:hypothetical protein